MSSMDSGAYQFERESLEIDRVLEIFKNERKTAVNRQISALDKYDEEMKQIGELDDIDRELGLMEAQQRGVDHNIMRHTSQSIQADDNYDDNYYEVDDFANENQVESNQKPFTSQMTNVKKETPTPTVKTDMRVALFGFLEASQNDEDELELIYERSKEEGGKVAELAAENLFETQKANLSALLRMLEGYQPRQSGNAWTKDPDYLKLMKKLDV